jgi:hypothetical protein
MRSVNALESFVAIRMSENCAENGFRAAQIVPKSERCEHLA